GQQGTAVIDLVAQRHPGEGGLVGLRGTALPVGDGQLLGPVEIDHVVDVAVVVDVGGPGLERRGEDLPARRRFENAAHAASMPCSCRNGFSSPLENISRTMS